mgnify:CR=1 FL=1
MTYDFSHFSQRSRNPIEKDPMFQKMNENGIIMDVDLEDIIEWCVYGLYLIYWTIEQLEFTAISHGYHDINKNKSDNSW